MAFLPSSRYAKLDTVEVDGPGGRRVTVVKLRRPALAEGDPVEMQQHDRLDVMARDAYGDGTGYWRIADANTELWAGDLSVPGRVIRVPRP